MRLWFLMLAGLLWAQVAHAQWVERSWPDYVRDADLIVRARVAKGGTWGATVDVEQVYAGKAPASRITVVGINDPMFPPEILEQQTWRTGDIVWLFLNPWKGPRWPGEPELWTFEDLDTPQGLTYAPPSPLLADIPLRDDGVHVRFVAPVMPDPAGAVPRADWEAVLADLIRVYRKNAPAQTLASARKCLGTPIEQDLSDRFAEPTDAACLGRLAVLGESRWDDRLPAYAASTHPATRGALGALAVHLDDPRADKLIVDAILDEHELVRSLTVGAALDGRKDRLGDAIAVLLPASRWSPPPPMPVEPERIRPESARMNIIHALGALARPKDEVVFVNEMPFANPKAVYAMVEAMHNIRRGSWVPSVVELLDAGERGRIMPVLEVTHELREPLMREPLQDFIQRTDLEADLIRRAMWALEPIGDAETARLIRARLRPRLTDAIVWDSATTDMVAAELSLLGAIEGPGARDLAFDVARLYLSFPAELSRDATRARWDAFVEERTRRATGVLPPGSEVELHIVASRAQLSSGDLRRARVYVDGKVPEGLLPAQRQAVAEALGIPASQIRLCGRGPGGGHRCHEDRGQVWRLHPVIAAPVLRILGEAGGYGEHPLQPTDATAQRWMALAMERGLADRADADGVIEDLVRAKARRDNPPPPPPPMLPPGWRRP